MSRFVLHPEAFSDLDTVWNFIAEDSLDAADRVIQELLSGSLSDPLAVPAGTKIAWLVPDAVRSKLGTALPPATWNDPVPSTIMEAGHAVQLGPYTVHPH